MRYAPPGLCVNDFALLRDDDGTYALLHLQGPWTPEFDHLQMETSYGRATSTDLVGWQPQGTTFGNGLPDRFDQRTVWTMHPFRHGGGMAMFYTGVSGLTPDGWPLQSPRARVLRQHRRHQLAAARHRAGRRGGPALVPHR
ncbi:hypothetical protein [Streptomyces armeniacus]|uniref:hypothetical protein n=1 Tax=Streptomyces armeniacus TaxID=83291 RepID=UPI001FECA3DD|nr:hypothetical protein [Streptomyces armeniacus]